MTKQILAWLTGRGRRAEYWIAVVAITVASLTLTNLTDGDLAGKVLDWTSLAAWCLFAARRLRDVGLPFWLAPFPLAVVLAGQGIYRLMIKTSDNVVSALGSLSAVNLVTALVVVALIILLGAWRSKPAPPPTPKEQAEVFA